MRNNVRTSIWHWTYLRECFKGMSPVPCALKLFAHCVYFVNFLNLWCTYKPPYKAGQVNLGGVSKSANLQLRACFRLQSHQENIQQAVSVLEYGHRVRSAPAPSNQCLLLKHFAKSPLGEGCMLHGFVEKKKNVFICTADVIIYSRLFLGGWWMLS